MKYNIVISTEAKNDLIEIFKYIAYTLLVPDTAIDQLESNFAFTLQLQVFYHNFAFIS